jgi:hypothetical protein
MSDLLPEWLTQPFFYGEDSGSEDSDEEGAEEEDSEDTDDEGSEGGDSGEEDSEDGDEEDGDDEEEEEDPYEGLRSALSKERKLHRVERRNRIKAERELESARSQLAAGTNKESEAITELQTKLDEERSQTASLAKKFSTQAVNGAIKTAAEKLGFIDPEDALVVARNIEVDQDDEDPTQVEVDEALVLSEVKALAKKKPHLVGEKKTEKTTKVKSGTSARRTNQRRTKSTKSTKERELMSRYPSLQ